MGAYDGAERDREVIARFVTGKDRWDPYAARQGLRAARARGEEGDSLFADGLTNDPDSMLAAMLGDLSGAAGNEALRGAAAASGAGTQDLRCAALLALAKRLPDGEATPTLVEGLASRNGTVKEYAILGLAGAGDARGWEPAFACLRQWLGRAAIESDRTWWAACYLAQFAGDREVELIEFLRKRWARIGAGGVLIEQRWPEVVPGGPPADDVVVPAASYFRAFARRDPLFSASDA